MPKTHLHLGIDIGSVSIAVALMDHEQRLLHHGYTFHKGRITEHLLEFLKDIEPSSVSTIAYTSSCPSIIKYGQKFDSRIAYISAAKHFHPGIQSLLIIGAEKFGLVTYWEGQQVSCYDCHDGPEPEDD